MTVPTFVMENAEGLAVLLSFHSLLLATCFWLWLEYRQ